MKTSPVVWALSTGSVAVTVYNHTCWCQYHSFTRRSDSLGPQQGAPTTAQLGSQAPSRRQVLGLSPGCWRWLVFSASAVLCPVYSDLSALKPQLFPEGYTTQQMANKQYKTWFHAVMLLFLSSSSIVAAPWFTSIIWHSLFSSTYFFFLLLPLGHQQPLLPKPFPCPTPRTLTLKVTRLQKVNL